MGLVRVYALAMLVTNCAEDPAVCCVDLFAIATHLLTSSYDALAPCFEGIECAPLAAYVTMGGGDDGVVDALTVEINQTAPVAVAGAGGRTLPLPAVRAAFTVRLRESGWPTVRVGENGQIFPPDPVTQNRAARQALAHGEKLYRNLLHLNATRNIIPEGVAGCGAPTLGALTPITPLGGVVGWFVPITVDVLWGGG